MTDQIAELETRLHEKDELVGALTQRLEQAAEQLDRMQRSGGDRASKGGGGGIPHEMLEDQRTLTQELQHAVTQWGDSQPTETLERIESRLTELRELLQTGGGGGISSAAGSGAGDTGLSGYEALKASMMTDDPHAAPTESSQEEPAADAVAASPEASFEPQEELPEPDQVDAPVAIDVSSADMDALKDAVESRDQYIAYLIQKVRVAESRTGLSVNWEALNDAPEELQTRLQSLESRLEDTLRLTEVELSLERARLGREANRLEQLEQQIEKEQKKLGIATEEKAAPGSEQEMTSSDDSDMDLDDEDDEDAQGNRWLRMLGR